MNRMLLLYDTITKSAKTYNIKANNKFEKLDYTPYYNHNSGQHQLIRNTDRMCGFLIAYHIYEMLDDISSTGQVNMLYVEYTGNVELTNMTQIKQSEYFQHVQFNSISRISHKIWDRVMLGENMTRVLVTSYVVNAAMSHVKFESSEFAKSSFKVLSKQFNLLKDFPVDNI